MQVRRNVVLVFLVVPNKTFESHRIRHLKIIPGCTSDDALHAPGIGSGLDCDNARLLNDGDPSSTHPELVFKRPACLFLMALLESESDLVASTSQSELSYSPSYEYFWAHI